MIGKISLSVMAALLAESPSAACDNAVPAVGTRAKVNLADLISSADYPPASRATREQGLVEFTLDVGPNGRVMGCSVTRSSGSPLLDSTACRLVRSRARFTPALNDSGQTVADEFQGRILWRL